MGSSDNETYKTAVWAANCKMVLAYLKDAAQCFAAMEEQEWRKETQKLGRKIIQKAFKKLPEDLYGQIIGQEQRVENKTEGTGI